ncbi:MAG: adenylate/guanylate cyclase domain-containing protein [Anaerolineales bacterium]|nr:adenylate/guanylate cyclase domain-containing protein [Anaerolineales bacterium]
MDAGIGRTPNAGTADPMLDSGRIEATGQRRPVTILFCDIKGSTALAEQVDPEEWADIVRGAFETLIPAIKRYGGTIARLMGDAVLAFFGAPTAHEDDPYRAVRAGLDILREYEPYQGQVVGRLRNLGVRMDETDFEVRIGIHTGLVVVGRIGAGANVEYTAMGDATNTAKRLQESASPGTIQISHETFREIAGSVEAIPLGGIQVKGKQDPVSAYRILRLKSRAETGFPAEGVKTPLVGRQPEKLQLNELLAQLRRGQGQIVAITGDAGIGKSRLVQEILAGCQAADDLACYQAASLSFESGQPYGMIRRLIRDACGAGLDDRGRFLERQLESLLASVPKTDQPEIKRAFEVIFSGETSEGEPVFEGDDIRQAIINGMNSFWRFKSRESPTVLVAEDLHWSDQASMGLLEQLFRICDDVPIMFILVFRSDPRSAAWSLKNFASHQFPARYTELTLEPLLPWESDLLAAELLGAEQLPDEIQSYIQDKTEGNPFFIEELVQELVEREVVVQDSPGGSWRLVPGEQIVGIPDSLQSLLLSRIDRLDGRVQKTIQYASVIGRTFNYQVLARTVRYPLELEGHLDVLEQAALVRQTNRVPDLEYSFHHTIVQEAVYAAILRRDRIRYHHRVGEAMAEIFEERINQVAPMVAFHYDKAGDRALALKYYSIAGDNAAKLFANTEAIEHYTKAIEAVNHTPTSATQVADLYRRRAIAFETNGDFDHALADYEQTCELGEDAQDSRIVWQSQLDLGKLWTARDYTKADLYFSRALELSRGINDPLALARSLNRTGNWLVNAEQPQESFQHHQEALGIFEALGDASGQASTLDLLGMAYLLSADPRSAAAYFSRAIASFRELGDQYGLASSLTSFSLTGANYENLTVLAATDYELSFNAVEEALQVTQSISWHAGQAYALFSKATVQASLGQLSEALKTAQNALELATRIDHKQWMSASNITLGLIYLEFELLESAKDYLEQGVVLAREIDSGLWTNLGVGALALALTLSGNFDAARKELDEVLAPLDQIRAVGERSSWFSRAVLAVSSGEPDYAIQILDHLVRTVPNNESGEVVPWLAFIRGDALMSLGRVEDALETFISGYEATRTRGLINLEWRYDARLSNIYRQFGQEDLAERHSTAARKTLNDICTNIIEVDLRESFEARAERNLSSNV